MCHINTRHGKITNCGASFKCHRMRPHQRLDIINIPKQFYRDRNHFMVHQSTSYINLWTTDQGSVGYWSILRWSLEMPSTSMQLLFPADGFQPYLFSVFWEIIDLVKQERLCCTSLDTKHKVFVYRDPWSAGSIRYPQVTDTINERTQHSRSRYRSLKAFYGSNSQLHIYKL